MDTIYIAGPMRGYPRFNFDAFDAAEKELAGKGYNALSPHRMELDHGFDPSKSLDANGFDLKEAVRRDVEAIIAADAVYMLKGWEQSAGATAEFHIARWLDKEIIFEKLDE